MNWKGKDLEATGRSLV